MEGGFSFKSVKGEKVRLRFDMKDAKLYCSASNDKVSRNRKLRKSEMDKGYGLAAKLTVE